MSWFTSLTEKPVIYVLTIKNILQVRKLAVVPVGDSEWWKELFITICATLFLAYSEEAGRFQGWLHEIVCESVDSGMILLCETNSDSMLLHEGFILTCAAAACLGHAIVCKGVACVDSCWFIMQ